MGRKNNKDVIKTLSLERIYRLFELAELASSNNTQNLGILPENYASKYAEMAFKISKKNKVTIPSEFKMRFCRHCFTYFNSLNFTIRKKGDFMSYTCKNCGYNRKIFIGKREEKTKVPKINHRKKSEK